MSNNLLALLDGIAKGYGTALIENDRIEADNLRRKQEIEAQTELWQKKQQYELDLRRQEEQREAKAYELASQDARVSTGFNMFGIGAGGGRSGELVESQGGNSLSYMKYFDQIQKNLQGNVQQAQSNQLNQYKAQTQRMNAEAKQNRPTPVEKPLTDLQKISLKQKYDKEIESLDKEKMPIQLSVIEDYGRTTSNPEDKQAYEAFKKTQNNMRKIIATKRSYFNQRKVATMDELESVEDDYVDAIRDHLKEIMPSMENKFEKMNKNEIMTFYDDLDRKTEGRFEELNNALTGKALKTPNILNSGSGQKLLEMLNKSEMYKKKIKGLGL